MKVRKIKFLKKLVTIGLMVIVMAGEISAKDAEKKYSLSKIFFTGNSRIPERKIRELISIKEGMNLPQKMLEFEMNVSKAKLESTGLFMFVDTNLETRDDGTAEIFISMGENVILLEIAGLEQGGLTRFSSISQKAPDFGFMVGSKSQALFFRFPYFMKSPLNLATTITHHAYEIPFDSQNAYDYEAASARAAVEATILTNWKVKIPAIFRYNIKGDTQSTNTSDFSTGLETLIDFSHYRNVIYTGFDINSGIYQGIGQFSYTLLSAGLNVYFKPFKWEELILRGRYNSVLNGNVPDYVLFRVDNEYQVRGHITNHYYGRNSLVLNAENWFHNIVSIPVAITNINFSMVAFVDMGTAGNQIGAIGIDTWNLSAGGAVVIDFTAPLNISLQAGYGHELWQNTGGQFYVKMGYEFRMGNFFE